MNSSKSCPLKDLHLSHEGLMKTEQREKLLKMWAGGILLNYPLGRRTTLGVGGSVEALYEADDRGELQKLLTFLQREKIPYLVVGRGSNLVVRDEGVEGVAIRLKGPLAAIELEDEEEKILRVGAGASLSQLLEFCRPRGLGGFEFLAGIPGSLGGAVVMNAGAFGQEISQRVIRLGVLIPESHVSGRRMYYRELSREKVNFHYRGIKLKSGSVVVDVWLMAQWRPPHEISKLIKSYLEKRRKRQPLEYPSAGSIFKNPAGHFAGELIEAAGLKGRSEGSALISEKHANFILNMGGATAAEVLSLIELARLEVKKRFGVELECEVKVVGRGQGPCGGEK